jgi:hypothetical protein
MDTGLAPVGLWFDGLHRQKEAVDSQRRRYFEAMKQTQEFGEVHRDSLHPAIQD